MVGRCLETVRAFVHAFFLALVRYASFFNCVIWYVFLARPASPGFVCLARLVVGMSKIVLGVRVCVFSSCVAPFPPSDEGGTLTRPRTSTCDSMVRISSNDSRVL